MSISTLYDNKETRDGIKINKGYLIPVNKINIEPGYNVRKKIDPDHVDTLAEAITNAGGMRMFPAIFVAETAEGIFVKEGHHRLLAARKAGVEFIECKDVTGLTEQEYIELMVNSNDGGKKLQPIDRANAYYRWKELGLTNAEIAKLAKRSEADVQIHLAFLGVSDVLKQHVEEGKITYAQAVRTSTDKSVADPVKVLEKAIEVAESKGKRVTPKIINEVKIQEVLEEVQAAEAAIDMIEKQDNASAEPDTVITPRPDVSSMSREEKISNLVLMLHESAPIVLGTKKYLLVRDEVNPNIIMELVESLMV